MHYGICLKNKRFLFGEGLLSSFWPWKICEILKDGERYWNMDRGVRKELTQLSKELAILLMSKQNKSKAQKNDVKRTSRRKSNGSVIFLCSIVLDYNITWKGKDFQNRDHTERYKKDFPYLKPNFSMNISKCIKKWGWSQSSYIVAC